MLYGVIIAGGLGKRLWPKSKRGCPKYLFRLNKRHSLLQEAIDCVRPLVPINNILIMSNRDSTDRIFKELPSFPRRNVIAEPVSRNTAAAICVAAAIIRKRDPNGILIVLPADQFIRQKKALTEIFRFASFILAIKDCLITLGIRPTFAATGYGYIKAGACYKRLITKKRYEVFRVDRFIEKPNAPTAKRFIRQKAYLWNAGIFIGKASTFLDECARYRPDIYRVIKRLEGSLGTARQQAVINRYYKRFPDISIDYAIMEKTKKAYVIKADITLQDIGSWLSLEKCLKKDRCANSIDAEHIGIDTRGSLIVGEKGHLIATLGLDNIILIHTPESTLVCSKQGAQGLKLLVDAIAKKKSLQRYL